jgi:NAD(P)-dependent dehydrogenase (short-subunit alcohol dehydrogenase family)
MSDSTYRALVIGSSGALGAAFVNAFKADPFCVHVAAVSRANTQSFDLTNAQSIADTAAETALECGRNGPFHYIIDATGALTVNGLGPEKSLQALNAEQLARAFQINAIGPVMVLRHFAALLAPGPSVYAKLSARVGSITDNKKGGWYGYRASKAALNMLLQTAAIELQRKNPQLRVVALQPGTVRSKLSAPFVGSMENIFEPEESVSNTLKVLPGLAMIHGAHFIDFKGNPIPW